MERVSARTAEYSASLTKEFINRIEGIAHKHIAFVDRLKQDKNVIRIRLQKPGAVPIQAESKTANKTIDPRELFKQINKDARHNTMHSNRIKLKTISNFNKNSNNKKLGLASEFEEIHDYA